MSQPGFFDLTDRYAQISRLKDPLEQLNAVTDWKQFLPLVNRAFQKHLNRTNGYGPIVRIIPKRGRRIY